MKENIKDQKVSEFTPFLFKVDEDLKPKLRTIKLKDIKLPKGYENENFMVNSIEGFGVIEPIWLSKSLEIIDGRRRIYGNIARGETEIEAFVINTDDKIKIATLTLLKNYARSSNPISELEALEIMEKKKVSEKFLIQYLNFKKPKATSLKKLLELPPGIYKALKLNKITTTLCHEIAAMKKPAQARLEKLFEKQGYLTAENIKAEKDKDKKKLADAINEIDFKEEKSTVVWGLDIAVDKDVSCVSIGHIVNGKVYLDNVFYDKEAEKILKDIKSLKRIA